MNSVKLTNTEQKLISDRVQKIINSEIAKRVNTKPLEDKIQKGYEKFLDLQKQVSDNVKTLEQLKKEELQLSIEVAKIFVSDDQKMLVKDIEEELELLELQVNAGINQLETREMEKSNYAKEAFDRLSKRLEDLIKEQLEN